MIKMKNNIYKIIDKNNDIYINCFVALNDKLAIDQTKSNLKKTKYIFDNTQNINEKANINAYFNNAQFYELVNENNQTIFKYNEIIKIKENEKK